MQSTAAPLVAFSHDVFTGQIVGGVSRCMIELMRSLSEMGVDWSAWAGQNGNVMLREAMELPWAQQQIYSVEKRHRGRLISSVLEEPAFATWVRAQSPVVVHRTYYPIVDLVRKHTPQVETLHDLWDERATISEDKGALLRSILKKRACDRADAIVCVSEHTRDEAVNRWPAIADKITVIPHGVRCLSLKPIPANIPKPYFLFVGHRGLYKNFMTVAEALMRSDLDHSLVCFGGGPISDPEMRLLSALKILDRIEQISGSDDRLAGLYENATALLYPSSFEGFGLPLLEAMVHRCPVISSPLTSLPEVGGDAVLYANPSVLDAWVDAMQSVVHDSSLGPDLRARGERRAAQFTWSRSAESHRTLYNSLS